MNIHQLSIKYLQEQDRILVRINSRDGQEWRLWLTRRLALKLLPNLRSRAQLQLTQKTAQLENIKPLSSDNLFDPLSEQRAHLVAQFQQEAQSYAADYATPFAEAALKQKLPEPPLLITDIELSRPENGLLRIQLIEQLAGSKRDVQLSMESPLAQGFVHLLTQAIQTAQWLQATTLDTTQAATQTPSAVLGDGSDKPKYLN